MNALIPFEFTILNSDSELQTKIFNLNDNGGLEKTSAASAYDGHFKVHQSASLTEFNALLDKLKPRQSLIIGTPHRHNGTPLLVGEKIALTTSKKPSKTAIPRTKEHIKFTDYAGLSVFDIDGGVSGGLEAYNTLLEIIPELNGAACLIRPSSSSYISTHDGVTHTGGRGFHIFFVMKKGSDSQRIKPILWARMWLKGYGKYCLNNPTKAEPSLLNRGFYDNAVMDGSERIFFESNPILKNGLVRNAKEHTHIIDGGLFDSSLITELTPDDVAIIEQLQQAAKEAIEPERRAKRKATRKQCVIDRVNAGKTVKEALRDYRAASKHDLPSDFVLFTEKGERTAGSLTANDDGIALADPLEPDTNNLTKAKFYWNNGKPIINSFLHGGAVYKIPCLNAHTRTIDTDTTTAKAKTETKTASDNAPQDEINGLIPTEKELPCYRVLESFTQFGDRTLKAGTYLFWLKETKDGEKFIIPSWICSPLYIKAVTKDQHGNNYGRYLHFETIRGGYRYWCMAMAMLKGSGDDLRGELLSQGVLLNIDDNRLLPRYLNNFLPRETLEISTQTGWHKEAYILPDRCIGSDKYFYQSENFHTDVPYRQSGSLTDWQNQIGRYCVDNPLLMLSVCTALAGALLKKAHQTGGGFHIFGDSSKGKTTGLAVACSVFGDETFKRSWKATSNGMEATAAMFNDSLLALDEVSECDPKEVGAIVYAIGNGVGKSRANRSGGSKATYQWLVMALSNGERSINDTMSEAGKQTKAGQSIRLLSIPVFGKHGAFNSLHDKKDGRELSDHLQTAVKKIYGTAGIEYLTKLVKETRNIDELAEQYTLKLINGETLSSQESRAAKRFALVALAGELATEYGVTGWQEGQALAGVYECFEVWREHFGGGDMEDRQVLQSVKDFIDRFGDSRFSNMSSDDQTKSVDRAGYWSGTENGRVYLFNDYGIKEALNGYGVNRGVEILKKHDWLVCDSNRLKKNHRVYGKSERFYTVKLPEVEL
jgi:putative DNA primase/helicase